MSKVLYLNEARQHTLSAGPKNLIRLTPGRNVVEDDDYEAVIKCKTKDGDGKELPNRLQELIDDGIVKVVGESVNIKNMAVPEALEIVELETSEEGLLDLLDQENTGKKTRKTIVKAIEAKMDAIDKANKAPTGSTEEGSGDKK